jgi:hypothetical protein
MREVASCIGVGNFFAQHMLLTFSLLGRAFAFAIVFIELKSFNQERYSEVQTR